MALDQRKLGENNHHEYTWSESSFEEHFSQFYFQLVRSENTEKLEIKLEEMLIKIKNNEL